MTVQLAGHCHCGAVRVILEPGKPVGEMPLRACRCSFCRTRCAETTSDPGSHLFVEAAPGALERYQFGLGVTDFLLCAECGTYMAAVSEIDGAQLGIVNVRGANLQGFEGREPDPMVYDDETAEQRLARRAARWMPVVVTEVQPSI
jgi:hypothetical protein